MTLRGAIWVGTGSDQFGSNRKIGLFWVVFGFRLGSYHDICELGLDHLVSNHSMFGSIQVLGHFGFG